MAGINFQPATNSSLHDLLFVQANGATLAYRLAGPPEGPLIITLHGGRGMGNHEPDFRAYRPLTRLGYRVLSFDYRGHGHSSRTKPYTFEQLVDDTEVIRKRFSGPKVPVVICGGGFGGFLAIRYALKYGQWVKKLVLRGTAASFHHKTDMMKYLEERLDKVPGLSKKMVSQHIYGKYKSDLEFRLVHHAILPLYSENVDANSALETVLDYRYNAEAHHDLYSSDEKHFDYRDSIGEITVKTLVMVGEKDWICPPEHSEFLWKSIPNAELFLAMGAGHCMHLGKNVRVLNRMGRFLGTA